MLTLPADRMMSVMQNVLLRDSVAEKEVHEATKKAKNAIHQMAQGLPLESPGATYGTWEDLPIDDEFDAPADASAATRRNLGPLQPETVPSDDESNPFPGLERPLG